MRGIGAGDSGARVIGQYGLPGRVVYLKDDKEGAVMMYGYDFPQEVKLVKSWIFILTVTAM